MSHSPLSRRAFLRHAACAAVGTTALASTVWNLRALNAAAAANTTNGAGEDFKALVCLFLYGGNDSNNLLIPTDSAGYNTYAAARADLAIPAAAVLPLAAPRTYSDGHTYGLHPSMGKLQSLYNNGKLALVANVGTLIQPVTRADWTAGAPKFPPQLFSHNDQQVQWQTSLPDQPSKTGWGGRLADLLVSMNGSAQVSMSISLAGTNTFQIGNQVSQYQVSPYGVVGLNGYTGTGATSSKVTFDNLLNLPHQNLFEGEFAKITKRALANNALLSQALSTVTLNTPFPTYAAGSGLSGYLGDQLKMVAKLIAARSSLGMKRQVFFCSVGGYDTHGDQLGAHSRLLTELSDALDAFHNATVELNVENQVTAFTASDFGRTFPVNGGAGSDHGWGSHHLVMGGAVQGQDLYGRFPTLSVNGPDDTGQGRWIPTTSVDEYSATLARWFGVDANGMQTVFPNLGRFARPNLGFLA